MSYSVGLTLYNLARRGAVSTAKDPAPRPSGRLVWLHAADADILAGMLLLGQALIEEDGLAVLLSCPEGVTVPRTGAVVQKAPADFPADIKEFLNYWSPELIIWSAGELRPALIHEAASRGIPTMMVECAEPRLMEGRDGWYPGLLRGALAPFRSIRLLDAAVQRALVRAGADPARLLVCGKLERPAPALPYLEAERASLAGLLAGRPVWLAVSVPPEEEEAVIAAHRHALALSHRLLLILVPQDPARAEALAKRCEAGEGWQVARRSAEEEPEPQVEVFIPDQPGESGLWYRLAPVTFLGGSLLGAGCQADPAEPASTGSAILLGPRQGNHAGACLDLLREGAARLVGSDTELPEALSDLLSPDRAARQAHLAWAVVSAGAETSQNLLAEIRLVLSGPN